MSQPPKLARAGVLTGFLALSALACSSDLVELLPLMAGASGGGAGGAAGQDTTASGSSSASGSGGRHAGGSAGSPTSQGGFAGAPQAGGGHGDAAGASGSCFGPGCAGDSGFGGSFGGPHCGYGNSCWPCDNNTQCPFDYEYCADNECVQCTTEGPSQCRQGNNCDVLVRHCEPRCDATTDCKDGRVCDLNQGTCVWCIDSFQCQQDGVPGNICYLHRCVDCTQNAQCVNRGERRLCSGTRCVECSLNEDCTTPGKSHCDTFRGSCE